MERLRPVYETGVLRLLLRGNSMLYVALLRSSFDPLTGELPRDVLEERISRSLSRLAETGDQCGILVQASIGHGYSLDRMFGFRIARGTSPALLSASASVPARQGRAVFRAGLCRFRD